MDLQQIETETDNSFVENDSEDDDDELFDAKSNKSREDNETNEVYQVAQKTNTSLQLWRIASLLILVGTFVAILTSTFLIINAEHEDDDEEALAVTFANALGQSEKKLREYNQVMRLMAQSITASTTETSDFPFVRVPNFELLGRHARVALGSPSILWAPFVTELQRPDWSSFCYREQGWYNESLTIFQSDHTMIQSPRALSISMEFREFIWEGDNLENVTASDASEPYAPIWHVSPPPRSSLPLNYDILYETYIQDVMPTFVLTRDFLLTASQYPSNDNIWAWVAPPSRDLISQDEVRKDPFTTHLTPVFRRLNDINSTMVGVLLSKMIWIDFISSLFHKDDHGIVVVLHNDCNQSYTYAINNGEAEYVGEGDIHDLLIENANDSILLNSTWSNGTQQETGQCVYSLLICKTKEFYDEETDKHIFYVLIAFSILALTFILYDRFVNKKNQKILYAAKKANAIISSLFPAQVRERLFLNHEDPIGGQECAPSEEGKKFGDLQSGVGDTPGDYLYKTKPIADLFPETTILFADIVGFTAWSSVREPTQVFILLETLFRAFDEIAKKRRVFKVETVGDCYVAVTGLPKPRKDHAVAMARFAHESMLRMQVLVKKLEVTLGPDTGELSMRMGLHSGPVTAGVLRGERSRFQLFGDTMNTAARMEHNGQRDRIQITQDTADLLIAAGKTTWIAQREDVVVAKGKGEMQTYWLQIGHKSGQSSSDQTSTSNSSELEADQGLDTSKTGGNSPNMDASEEGDNSVLDPKTSRLVQWNVDVLLRLIKQIVAHRRSCPILPEQKEKPKEHLFTSNLNCYPIDEVKEIITLPGFQIANSQEDPDEVVLQKDVVDQMHEYVTRIACNYRRNPFHSFEHASHVTMSVVKLLSRIVAPQHDESEIYHEAGDIASTLHDHTYGITSDPLTQFSCVLSALIHDVDHPGVSNAQLIKESSAISQRYKGKSPSEQHAIDFAWNLLMEDHFSELRFTIYQTDAELVRFRQLIVNSVMATDKADKELKRLRESRWDRAFSSNTVDLDQRDTNNRKATIVIEHLIQASDEAHTMQHWHIYRKWNERFFFECYKAYLEGRAEKNPADRWFEREIEFFDYYIIPLANKLKDCGVFGVSSDEYLNYAMRNRQEWEARGRDMVSEMLAKFPANDGKSMRT